MDAEQQAIICERRGGVALLTMNRPDQRNAMTLELVYRLSSLLNQLEHEPAVGAVVLAGAGKGFCAGSDLAGLARMSVAERAEFEAASGRVARMLAQFSKPVVAAAQAFAIGGGLTLATSCDIVVTNDASRWSLPEVPIGLFPAWGIASVVARAGMARARRLCWGIDTLSGREAVEWGLADMLAEDVAGAAMSVAERLSTLPQQQAMAVKRYFTLVAPDETSDVVANRLFMEATGTAEAKASFLKYGSR